MTVKLLAGVADSASALTLQEADNVSSSEESITASPGTMPNDTIDGTLSSLPFSEEDLVSDPADSAASAQTLQEPDASSSEESLDTTCEESIAASASNSELHDTADGSPASASSVGLGPPILSRHPPNWYQEFYLRKDCKGYFHMYPDLGGPFESLQEAEAAIDHHLSERRLPEMCQKPSEGSLIEWRIKQCLYYPDGTAKRGSDSPARKNPNRNLHQIVKALLDQYNDCHNPCKDLAYELKDLLSFQWIYEGNKIYYHFNFTTKTDKNDDVNLFFAEWSHVRKEDTWVISCCCMIEPSDDGHSYGCCNNGNHKLKHPNNTRAYIGGHEDGYLPFGGDDFSDEEEDEDAFVARLRIMFGV